MVTAEQIAAYHEAGFVAYPRLLTPDQVAFLGQRTADMAAGRHPLPEMIKRFPIMQQEPAIDRGDAQADDPLDRLRKINYPSHVDEDFRSIAMSQPIVDVVEALLGTSDIVMLGDQIFMKPPFHGSLKEYHQDSASWPHLVPHAQVTVWVALDDATIDNGCLRYLPGSHQFGLILPQHLPQVLDGPLMAAETAVEVPAGGCIFHHSLALHTSGPNITPRRRRGWALHFMPARTYNLKTPDEVFVDYLLVRGQAQPGYVEAI